MSNRLSHKIVDTYIYVYVFTIRIIETTFCFSSKIWRAFEALFHPRTEKSVLSLNLVPSLTEATKTFSMKLIVENITKRNSHEYVENITTKGSKHLSASAKTDPICHTSIYVSWWAAPIYHEQNGPTAQHFTTLGPPNNEIPSNHYPSASKYRAWSVWYQVYTCT